MISLIIALMITAHAEEITTATYKEPLETEMTFVQGMTFISYSEKTIDNDEKIEDTK